jgi:hypothetical protein
MIDETLLHARAVTGVTEPADGIGFDVSLSCGHVIWCAVRPGAAIVCGMCLTVMIEQVSKVRGLLEQMPWESPRRCVKG